MKPWLSLLLALLPGFAGAAGIEVPRQGGGDYHLHLTSLRAERYRTTIHQKYDFSCGSAAVATLLTYQYDFPVSEQTAFTQMYAHGDTAKISKDGFSLLDIKNFLAPRGFVADGFIVPLDKLAQQHLPAIVLIDERGYHHFVVVKGLADDRVLIGDPAKGTRSMPRSEFQKLWTNHLLFVVHNHRDQAIFNSLGDWRAAPMVRMGEVIDRSGLYNLTMPKRGPDDI
jgi:predicted double-glycine peptidase